MTVIGGQRPRIASCERKFPIAFFQGFPYSGLFLGEGQAGVGIERGTEETDPMSAEASPLQEIERRVQLRAKETSLDMAGEGGRAQLRTLIAAEVAAWSDGYKRGLRAFDLADYGP